MGWYYSNGVSGGVWQQLLQPQDFDTYIIQNYPTQHAVCDFTIKQKELFNSYTKYDPNNRLTVDSNYKVTVTALSMTEAARLYTEVLPFSDFNHSFEFTITDLGTASWTNALWAVSAGPVTSTTEWDAIDEKALYFQIDVQNKQFSIVDRTNNVGNSAGNVVENTKYYATITKTGTAFDAYIYMMMQQKLIW